MHAETEDTPSRASNVSGFSLESVSLYLPEYMMWRLELIFRLFCIIQGTKLLCELENTLCILKEPLAMRWAGKVEEEEASIFASLMNPIRLSQVAC
jgi:hypothetical protein